MQSLPLYGRILPAIILSSLCYPLFAATAISGDISSDTFSIEKNPYLVVEDIFIPENKHTVIPAGIILLFSDLTGLRVAGTLSAEGTPDSPVVFSCVNDSVYQPGASILPNPDDWNGIVISNQSDSAVFLNCIIKYSSSGIASQSPNLKIDNGLFFQNTNSLDINGKAVAGLRENEPFYYRPQEQPPVVAAPTISPTPDSLSSGQTEKTRGDTISALPPVPTKKKIKTVASLKTKLRITFAAVSVASLASAYFFHDEQRRRLKKIESEYSLGHDPSKEMSTRTNRIAKEGFCLGAMACSLLGLTLTFVF